jgi:hypothetical protein
MYNFPQTLSTPHHPFLKGSFETKHSNMEKWKYSFFSLQVVFQHFLSFDYQFLPKTLKKLLDGLHQDVSTNMNYAIYFVIWY